MTPDVSVIIATYNRPDGVVRLLDDLDQQTGFTTGGYEVIVVDDGSKNPISAFVTPTKYAYNLRLIEQANAGPGAARNNGIMLARAPIVVILDDDMRVQPDFLSAHRAAHENGAEVVQGYIVPPETRLPLFERWHADQLVGFANAVRDGKTRVRGAHVATGNVSLRRSRYIEVGGFDQTLKRSEDRDLGIRFEVMGLVLGFSREAVSVHHSDLAGIDVWLRRTVDYGVADSAVAAKYPNLEYVDPWRFFVAANMLRKPLLFLAAVVPPLGAALAWLALRMALLADRLGFERLAFSGIGVVYGLGYFRGVRRASGSLWTMLRGLGRYHVKRSRQYRDAGRAAPLFAWIDFRRTTAIDFAVMAAGRSKYLGEDRGRRWLADVITNIGFQMVFAIRVMRLLRDSGLRTLAKIASRMIRHVYAAEIHWDAEFAPGLSIIHGNGLVVSHGARVGEGCVLFHNVTLGMGYDRESEAMGAPTLERNVHVGPGSTLLGPIVLGAGTKVMAGSVLNRSVPQQSRVRPVDVEVISRPSGRRAVATPAGPSTSSLSAESSGAPSN